MKITDIKRTMREWYDDSESYIELYNSLRILRSANLISRETFEAIVKYDEKLFQESI